MRFDINEAKGGFLVTTTDDEGKVIAKETVKDLKAALAEQKKQHKEALEPGDVS